MKPIAMSRTMKTVLFTVAAVLLLEGVGLLVAWRMGAFDSAAGQAVSGSDAVTATDTATDTPADRNGISPTAPAPPRPETTQPASGVDNDGDWVDGWY